MEGMGVNGKGEEMMGRKGRVGRELNSASLDRHNSRQHAFGKF